MNINHIFRNSKSENFFATVSRDEIEDNDIKYIFPLNYKGTECYKIDRVRMKSLMDSNTLTYNTSKFDGSPYVKEAQYKFYFPVISRVEADKLVGNN